MRTPSAQSDESGSIASYLADREGLEGKGREAFLNLLHTSFGFKLQRPRWANDALGAWVAVLTLGGYLFELYYGSGRTLFAWTGNVAVGALLVFALVWSGRRSLRSSREIEWRVYCLLIRPVIITERPGLLDRNSGGGAGLDLNTHSFFRLNYKALWQESWANLWLPATIGWSFGIVALWGWRLLRPVDEGIFVLPLGCTVLTPLGWGVFRLLTLWRMERTVRDRR